MESTAQTIPTIAPPNQQQGQAEINAARLIHQAGLVEAMASHQDRVVWEVDNGTHLPLRISRYGNQLYFTNYLPAEEGKRVVVESRLVFYIQPDGQLSLKKIDLEHSRGEGEQMYSRRVAEIISHKLLALKYDEAARQTASQVAVESEQDAPAKASASRPRQSASRRKRRELER